MATEALVQFSTTVNVNWYPATVFSSSLIFQLSWAEVDDSAYASKSTNRGPNTVRAASSRQTFDGELTGFHETSTTASDGTVRKTATTSSSDRRLRDRLSHAKFANGDRAPASTAEIILSLRSSLCKPVVAASEC